MTTPSYPSASPEQRPESACGICSAELCEHLRCRVCGTCEECGVVTAGTKREAIARRTTDHARYPFSQVRLSMERISHLPGDLQQRADYLRGLGIGWDDMADASRSIDELRSDMCGCGRRKRQYDSFCRDCYRDLPIGLRPNLNLHLKSGYLKYVREAWLLLAERRAKPANQQ